MKVLVGAFNQDCVIVQLVRLIVCSPLVEFLTSKISFLLSIPNITYMSAHQTASVCMYPVSGLLCLVQYCAVSLRCVTAVPNCRKIVKFVRLTCGDGDGAPAVTFIIQH